MDGDIKPARRSGEPDGPVYSAPALEKGLDILELLCRSDIPLSQREIAQRLGRSGSEIYRMVMCLVERGYLVTIADKLHVTTKLFELAHFNPPTHRLLVEAAPVMEQLSRSLDQSCHLTIYNQGRQVVLAKVDAPSGTGFSVRVGANLDVLVSSSGLVLVALQDDKTRQLRIEESLRRRPDHASPELGAMLDAASARGFVSIPSRQLRGLHSVSFPILDAQGHALAALTVPYAERIDRADRQTIPVVEEMLGAAAQTFSARMGWAGPR